MKSSFNESFEAKPKLLEERKSSKKFKIKNNNNSDDNVYSSVSDEQDKDVSNSNYLTNLYGDDNFLKYRESLEERMIAETE